MTFEIRPVKDECYEGRQWGYTIDGGNPEQEWHVTTGGTGECWNIEDVTGVDDPDSVALHVCNLEEFIAALETLRDSEAHKVHVARWS